MHGGDPVLRPVRDDPVALPTGQAARDRDDVPLHAAGRVQPHRALPAAAAGARRREPRDLAAGLPGGGVGLSAGDFPPYIDCVAARRLVWVGLEPLRDVALENPLPWLAE